MIMGNNVKKDKKAIIGKCREMVSLGLTLGTWGNISICSPDRGFIVITPSGRGYDRIDTEDLIRVDMEGNILEGRYRPSIETPLHLEIYKKRDDVSAIVHTHSIFATAAAVARTAIPAVTEELAQVAGGQVLVADYALPGSPELALHTVNALGSRNAVLLANHGVVGVGSDIEEAFQVCRVVERAALVYAYARMFGQPIALSEEDIQAMSQFYRTVYRQE